MHYIGIGQLIPFLLLLFSGSADASFRDGLLTSVVLLCNLRCYRGCSKASPQSPPPRPFRHLGRRTKNNNKTSCGGVPLLLFWPRGNFGNLVKRPFFLAFPLPSPSLCGLPSRCHERNGRGSRYPPSLLLQLLLLRQKVGIKVLFPQTPPCRVVGFLPPPLSPSRPLVSVFDSSLFDVVVVFPKGRGGAEEGGRHQFSPPCSHPTLGTRRTTTTRATTWLSLANGKRGGGTDGRKFNLTRYCRRHPFWEGERGVGARLKGDAA